MIEIDNSYNYNIFNDYLQQQQSFWVDISKKNFFFVLAIYTHRQSIVSFITKLIECLVWFPTKNFLLFLKMYFFIDFCYFFLHHYQQTWIIIIRQWWWWWEEILYVLLLLLLLWMWIKFCLYWYLSRRLTRKTLTDFFFFWIQFSIDSQHAHYHHYYSMCVCVLSNLNNNSMSIMSR